jgi:aspartate/methionine/tyrosine aminotransferase
MSVGTRAMAAPYIEWAKLCSGAKYSLATSGVTAYPLAELPVKLSDLEINGGDTYGYAPLRERLAEKFGTEAQCVVAATGTSMANHLVMAALLSPGDEVLIEKPAYAPLLEVGSYLRANVVRFERRREAGFQIDTEELKRKITAKTKLVVVTNPHNPSGALVEDGVLRGIGEIAEKVGAQVLVDEVYLSMAFDEPLGSIRTSFNLGGNFIITSSLTKAYGLSGLRCGWILARPELAERMWKLNDLFGVNAVHPGELLSVIALDHLGKIAARSKELLEVNRAALNQFLDGRDDLETLRPRFGTVVFPRLKKGSAEEFCKFLRADFETSVVPGHFFEMPEHFRVGIGGESEMTKKGLEQLGRALDAYGAK